MKRVLMILVCVVPLAAQEMPPAPVVVATVVEREISGERTFIGTVEAARVSTVGNEFEGLVVEFLAEEGQFVKKGTPLARLRTKVAEIRLKAAKAELMRREWAVRELKNGSRAEDIAEAKARLAYAEATLNVREWKLERVEDLFKKEAISEDELKDSVLLVKLAEADRAAVEAVYLRITAGPRKERIEQAEARRAVQKEIVTELEDQLERRTVRAPFDGYVVEEHTQVGMWLAKGDPVAEVAALDEVKIVAPVPEAEAVRVKVGEEVPFTINALPGRTLIGVISAVVPRANRRSRTIPVKVRLENPREDGRPLLLDGMSVTMRTRVGKKQRVLLVDKDAIVLGGPSPVVFVVDDATSTVKPVPVNLGIAVGGEVEVRGSLKKGAKVVVRGNERLRPGQSVRVTETLGG